MITSGGDLKGGDNRGAEGFFIGSTRSFLMLACMASCSYAKYLNWKLKFCSLVLAFRRLFVRCGINIAIPLTQVSSA